MTCSETKFTRIQLRRDTASDWTRDNPILAQGEAGYELDTGKLKIGDGTTHWNALSYFDDHTANWTDITGRPTALSEFTNDTNFVTLAQVQSGYTLPTAGVGSGGTLGGVKVDGTTITINNGVITANDQNLNVLGNLAVTDQTITGNDVNGDIILAPNGTGTVVVQTLTVQDPQGAMTGNMLSTQQVIEAIVTGYALNTLVAYSTGTGDDLAIGTYGNINGVAHPWAVLALDTVAPNNLPVSVIALGDKLGGEGIIPSTVVDRGTGQYDTYVILNLDLSGLTQILPSPGARFTLTRPLEKAGFDISTTQNTDIFLNSRGFGDVLVNTNILPVATNISNLGSPTHRWKEVWVGPGSIFVEDETLGVDLRLTAIDGNFVAAGSAGLVVGQFTLNNNNITIKDQAADFTIGVLSATGKAVFNRSIKLGTGKNITFSDDTVQTTAWNSTAAVTASQITGLAAVATSGDYADLSNTPLLATVATSGAYTDLSETPTLLSQFTNDAGYLTNVSTQLPVLFGNVYINGNTIGIVENNAQDENLYIRTDADSQGFIEFTTSEFHIHTNNPTVPVFAVDNNGVTTINASGISTQEGAVNIVGSSSGLSLIPQNAGVMLHLTGNDASPSRIYNDAAGNYAAYIGRRYNGDQTTPTGVLSGEIINRVAATPYLSTDAWPSISTARMDFVATENQSGTAQGNEIQFWTTTLGTTTLAKHVTIDSTGIKLASGITFSDSTVQTTAAIPLTQKGQAGGVATLGLDGKVTTAQLPAGAVVYKGTWNAATNTPTLANGTGSAGDEYSVSVEGTVNFGAGAITFNAGDFAIYNGTVWQRIPTAAGVTAFNERTGDVTLTSLDVTTALVYTPYNGATNINGYVNAGQAAAAAPVQSVFGRAGAVTLTSSDVTNALTAGSIANVKLGNPSLTVGSTTIQLGGTATAIAGLASISSDLFKSGTLSYTDTGILASLSSNNNSYNQLVMQNTSAGSSASANVIVSNNLGTATTNYGQFGMNSSMFAGNGAYNAPGAVYLTSVSTDLAIGTVGANSIRFFANNGTTDAMTLSSAGVLTVANTIQGNVSGNAGTVTNGVVTTGSYTNPDWITSLAYSKLTGAPTNLNQFTNGPGYLTGITSGQVTTALGFTPYNATNPSGYITSSALAPYALTSSVPTNNTQLTNGAGYITAAALTGYATQSYVTSQGYITSSALTGYATETFVTTRGYLTGITSSQVTTALGYTPGTGNGSVTSVSGTGTVSGLTLTGSVTSSGSLTLGGTLTLTSGQVTTALGYTPGTGNGTVSSISGTGTVSGLTLTGSVTSSGSLTLGGTLTLTSGQVTTALGFTPGQGTVTSLSGGNNIVITNPTTTPSITRVDGFQTVVTANTGATYSLTTTDQYFGTTRPSTGAITVTLPLGSTVPAGRQYVIKDESGNAGMGGRNITISRSGSDLIDGATTQKINSNYGSLTIMWTGSTWSRI